jgi:hypothetical protein
MTGLLAFLIVDRQEDGGTYAKFTGTFTLTNIGEADLNGEVMMGEAFD